MWTWSRFSLGWTNIRRVVPVRRRPQLRVSAFSVLEAGALVALLVPVPGALDDGIDGVVFGAPA